MHGQVLVIYPKDVDLETVMYPYQEIDKTISERIKDERCQFILEVEEKQIPLLLAEIKAYEDKHVQKNLEILQYRAEHTVKETQEKYGENVLSYVFDVYKDHCINQKRYETIKDLPYDDPEQIKFILERSYYANDKLIDIYIKGKGYGTYHNPYELWDFWNIVNKRRFNEDSYFLVDKLMNGSNNLPLHSLDVELTISNIKALTRVWETIILHTVDGESKIYTTNTTRFDERWNQHCVVDNIEKVLHELYNTYKEEDDYQIVALDFHW